jgi:3-phenylpropionate/trans-cinnamate dioxygenase ferredoxin reductase component
MADRFVIVGAGLAGAKAAETLRAEGFDGDLVLIGAEEQRPYERPPLSKGQLLGTAQPEDAYVHAPGWYAEHAVDLRTGTRATALDRAGRTVTLADGRAVRYDRLLLSTGSVPRHLPVPGADLDGVLYLRTMPDRERLDAALVAGARVVVIGGGWIGMEVAAAARSRGAEVTVVLTTAVPLQRVLGREIGAVFLGLHRDHGVRFHCGAAVSELTGTGRVEAVRLADGTVLPADVVVAGVGIRPDVALAEQAGLDVDNGICVDDALRSSDPRVFAAGDVANAMHPALGKRIRVEHWSNALGGGPAAARSMLGQQVSYDRVPYFFTDQYDLGMEYAGYAEPGGYDKVVFRGDPAGYSFLAFWVISSRVLAGMNVNIWGVQDDIQKLVRAGWAGHPVDVAALANPDVPLAKLATAAR